MVWKALSKKALSTLDPDISRGEWMSKYRRYLLAVVAAGAMVALTAPPAVAESMPVTDPIPEQPILSNLALTLQEFAQFPKSEPTPAPTDPRLMRWARINYIGAIPGMPNRLYTPDLNGKLYLLDRKGGTPHEYLDVAATFAPDFVSGRGLGTGFGFVAFHPEFKHNGKFYTVHSEWDAALTNKTPDLTPQPNTRFHTIIDEWTATDPRADTFSGTHREILRIGVAGQIHAIQQIDFRPNAHPHDADYGLLYIASGDGGQGAGNDNDDPQDLAIPQGKILRIDPLGTNSANGKYGIPASNPFVGQTGKLGEIYAYGMRDPHRFSWDPFTNRLFLGHIGEHAIEGVYDIRSGDNLGWPNREGNFVFNKADRCHLYTLPDDDAQFGYNYPVAAFDHDPPPGLPCTADSGHAISGGFVYRGFRVLPLFGKYLFADLVTGEIFYTNEREMRRGQPRAPVHQLQIVDNAGKIVTMQDLTGSQRIDLRFGRDAQGELYLLSKANGKIWKITGTRCVNSKGSAS
jgi:hypothetical protein